MPTQTRFDEPESVEMPDPARTALFLDFDGTLVEIADRPDGVEVDADLSDLLDRLDATFAGGVTLISGRSIDDLTHFLPDYRGPMIGSHGAESRRDDEAETHPFASDPRLPTMIRRARDWSNERPGTLVEEKPTGVVLHYRHAEDQKEAARAFLTDLVDGDDALEVHAAKLAYELRPVDAEKGAALERALRASGAESAAMIGDDSTDEPAMRAAQSTGGMAIKVGPGDTAADWRLEGPGAVRALLERWSKGAP